MKAVIIANLIALVAFGFNIIGTQQNEKGKILAFNGLANAFSCLQFAILGAWTGAISCVMAASRNVVFSLYKKHIPLYIFILYVIFVIAFNIPAITSIISVIPMLAIIFYGYALYQDNVGVLKTITVIVDVSCLVFDIYSLAFVSAISDSVASISAIIGLIRYLNLSKKPRKNLTKKAKI